MQEMIGLDRKNRLIEMNRHSGFLLLYEKRFVNIGGILASKRDVIYEVIEVANERIVTA